MSADKTNPLGLQVDAPSRYEPDILFGIDRAEGRERLNITGHSLPFFGADVWNAWELSWLQASGKPAVATAEIRVPSDSPRIVESKSLKLYLNSFNNTQFNTAMAVRAAIEHDLSECAGAAVSVKLRLPAEWQAGTSEPVGDCLDDLPLPVNSGKSGVEGARILRVVGKQSVERHCYSRLFRSLCPVTGQPDWATVLLHYRGRPVEPNTILAWLISYREHQEYHEQCVERLFTEFEAQCQPSYLCVEARYLRRGGLDINPLRASSKGYQLSNQRLFQQ